MPKAYWNVNDNKKLEVHTVVNAEKGIWDQCNI